MPYFHPNWENRYQDLSSSAHIWSAFVEAMKKIGFDSLIVYAFTIVPVRRHQMHEKTNEGFRIFEGNNLQYTAGGDFNNSVMSETVVKPQFISKDPLARHLRDHEVMALVGPDFIKEDDPFYEETIWFWKKVSEFCSSRNALAVPIHHFNSLNARGCGLHSSLPASEIQEIVMQQYGSIYFECMNFTKHYEQHYRRELAEKAGITRRQYDIIEMISMGLTNAEIAYKRDISEPTVSFHLRAIQERLSLNSTREIPIAASRLGLIDLL